MSTYYDSSLIAKIQEDGKRALSDLMIKSHSPLTKEESEQVARRERQLDWYSDLINYSKSDLIDAIRISETKRAASLQHEMDTYLGLPIDDPMIKLSFESLFLNRWVYGHKYSREEVLIMLGRGEISPSKAEEMLRERKEVQTPLRPYSFPEGQPCDHPGCLSHLSHPCEGCGRIGGRRAIDKH